MFSIFEIVSMTLFTIVMQYDTYHTQILPYGRTTITGFVAGLIMGNVPLGLLIGGTMELMSLGVGGYGGSSVPNYTLGAMIGVAFSAVSGGGIDSGLAVGIPVAALGVQLDVFGKMFGSFFLHKAQGNAEKLNLKGMYAWIFAGTFPRVLAGAVVVLIAMTAGSELITQLLAAMPKWLSTGLVVAGGLLPAVGFAILLKFLPIKKYYVYAVFGFTLVSFLKMSVMSIAILGFVAAAIVYSQNERFAKLSSGSSVKGDNQDE